MPICLISLVVYLIFILRKQECAIINAYHTEVCAYRVPIVFANSRRLASRLQESDRAAGALIIPSGSTAGFCRNPENRSPLMLDRHTVSLLLIETRDANSNGTRGWPRAAAGRFLLPPPPSSPPRLPPLVYLNVGRFMILHYRSTNYNPQIVSGVYSAAAPSTRIHEPRRASLAANTNTMHSPSHAVWRVRSLNTCPQK